MPGIAGLVSDKVETVLFNSMVNSMNHSSYIINTYTNDKGLHLSTTRHHFTNTASQPIHSSDSKYILVFYGEIFSVDGEPEAVIPDSSLYFSKLIETYGLNVLPKINGQFSAVLHDNLANTTYLISDRFGTQPLYYTISDKRLMFAQEVKALLVDKTSKKIDYHGIAELFSFGHLFGEKTLFEGVYLLPPATIAKFNQNSIRKTEYWSYPYSENVYYGGAVDAKEDRLFQEELERILTNAIVRQSSCSKNILIPLSGGLDSRFVAALYHRIGKGDLCTFTMGPDESEDQRYGGAVANALGYPHAKFNIMPEKTWEAADRFSYLSDGMSLINGPLQIFEPLDYFAGKKQIIAAPQMCDALFGSSLWRSRVRILQRARKPSQATNDLLVEFFNLFDQQQVMRLFNPEIFKEIKGLYRSEPRNYCNIEYHPLHNYYRMLMREHVRRGTLGGNLVLNLHYKTRMLSYDNDVFDFGWKLPIVYREHQYLYRKTFCKMFPGLCKIKRQGYNLRVDASKARYELKVLENKIATHALKNKYLRRIAKHYKPWKKVSYTNYSTWFKNELREHLTEFLIKKDLKCRVLLNNKYVEILMDEHFKGKRDNSALLWQVVNLEFFYKNFVN